MVVVILNCRLRVDITLHDIIQKLRASCSTGTNSLESKLFQQLTYMGEEVLYEIFMDLIKSYDALYRDRFLGIL